MSAVSTAFPLAHAILFQARFQPHSHAISLRGRVIPYGLFATHIERVTRRLAALAIPADARAAVVIKDRYLHWLVVIGLMRLGVTSTSLQAQRTWHDYARTTHVLTDSESVDGRSNIEVSGSWYTQPAADLPRHVDRPLPWNQPCRIVFSSGTTGTPKKIALTFGMMRMRTLGTTRAHGLNGATRLLSTMGIESVGGFSTPLTCWANGGQIVFAEPAESAGHTVARARPNVILASVDQLKALLDSLPENFHSTEHTHVYVSGSVVPKSLSLRARACLAQAVYVVYGSTEAGLIALAHAATVDKRPGFTGHVLSTAEVEIVDAQGQVRPAGEAGEIRIRGDGLAQAYLDDPEASARAFREGWFHSGDLATLDENGGLSVLGRIDELMNFGGTKVLPNKIEAVLSGVDAVQDVAVFALEHQGPIALPAAAVVAGDEFSPDAMAQRFRQRFKHLGELHVVRVPSIPRNEMGKVMRMQLAAQARAMLLATAGESAR